ncbi:MAG: P-type conjugative transfer protein TrbL [Novosphingobium sp.]|nr:P-type conjugative transfer protein TrbL [Novosphingobium sp.]
MNDTGVIDNFLGVFTGYIDSGFGLLGGEVAFLSTTLIAIDVTLAGLFWAWGADEDVLQRLVRKTLYIGIFAFIIGNFSTLATILFESFAGLGLKASGDALSLAEFMQPGSIAETGLDAAQPLIDATEAFSSIWSVFANLAIILVLLIAWLIVVLAFFIIAVQVFITLIEFKLVTLAGFVLLPFAFFGRTAFMAERVLGHIVSTGIKVLVLAVITGIGTTLFSQFTVTMGPEPDAEQVMAIALAALSLLGLSIFGPGIANGIVTGGPQLGAGAAAGTALAAGGALVGGAAAARLGAGAAAGAIGGTARGAAYTSGAARGAYAVGSFGKYGSAAVAGGAAGAGRVAAGAVISPLRKAAGSLKESHRAGARTGLGAAADTAGGAASSSSQPAWAAAMKRRQSAAHGASVAAHTMRAGDSHGGGSGPDIREKE